MGDYTPNALPGNERTFVAGAAITGGQVVYLSGSPRLISPTTGASAAVPGVAGHDAATGDRVTVLRGGEHKLTASGAITAGAKVKSAAAGAVAAWVSGTDNPSLILGTALNTAADTAAVDVAWGI